MMMPRRRANIVRDERADYDRCGGRYYCEEYREGFRILDHQSAAACGSLALVVAAVKGHKDDKPTTRVRSSSTRLVVLTFDKVWNSSVEYYDSYVRKNQGEIHKALPSLRRSAVAPASSPRLSP